MSIPLKFNTGGQIVMFGPFLDDTDGITNELSLAITAANILFHKKNAVSTVIHSLSGATHIVSGLYAVTMGTGDTDVFGPMTGYIDVGGALATKLEMVVMEADAYDALYATSGTGHIDMDHEGLILQATTIATLASQTSFTLTAGSTDDDAYNGATIVIVDASTGVQKAFGSISDYTGSTKTVTLAQDPGIFTMATTDKVYILSSDTFAVWDRVLSGSTHNIAQSAGKRLRQIAGVAYTDGTAQAGGSNTITLAAGESAIDDIFWQSYIAIVGGTGAGQGHHVVSYNGTTKVAVMDDDWVVTPDATSEYVIFGSGSHDEMMSGLAQAGAANTITLESTADTGDELIKDCYIVVVSGTGAHQARLVTAYNGTTKVATVYPDWVVNPDATSGYWIVPQGQNNVWDLILTGALHNIADSSGRRLRNLQEFGTYEGGAVFIDTVDGTAGTTDYESGTNVNPVDSIADAITIATSLNLKIFHIVTGSTITLAATLNNFLFRGHGWTLALGGQDVGGSHIEGPASVSGIGTGATEIELHQCEVGTVTVNKAHFDRCGFEGTVTLAAAASYELESCYSNDDNTLILDFSAGVGNTTVNLSGWDGKVELQNMGQTGTDVANIQGCGSVTINASCVGGTVAICGNMELTNNGSGQTINDDARIDTLQINTEVDSALNTAIPGSPTAGSVNDVLNDQARSAKTIQKGAAVSGTLSTTEMTTDLTVSVADQFNGRIIIFADDTTTLALRGQATDITATTVSGSKLGFTALTTVPVVGDTFCVV